MFYISIFVTALCIFSGGKLAMEGMVPVNKNLVQGVIRNDGVQYLTNYTCHIWKTNPENVQTFQHTLHIWGFGHPKNR